MAYQVIARKFRPQSFAEFVGQQHVTQTLLNALKSDRFPHAILFTGPRGTGKTSSARIVAKTLLCTDLKEQTPCGKCQNCIDVTGGRHLDVIEIDGASNNGVDHIRELRETVGYMPTSGKYKIYIIDEVHMLSTSAFNALLKTLEEPPPHVIFMFATTEVQKIPATILSRCQRFDFRNHTLGDIKNHLATICQKENIPAEENALWLIAKQAKGSIRDSLTLLDQIISFNKENLSQETVMSILGLTDRALLIETLQTIVHQDSNKMRELTQKILSTGYDPLLFLQDLLELFRNALMVKLGAHKRFPLEIPEAEVDELEKLTPSLSEEEVHLLFDVTLSGTQRVSLSSNSGVALEMLLFKLLAAPRLTRAEQFTPHRLEGSETPKTPAPQPVQKSKTPVQQAPTPAPVKKTSPPEPQKKAVVPPVEKNWEGFVGFVKSSNGFLGALLEHTCIYQETDEELIIGLPDKMKFLLDKLQEAKNLERTETFLKNFWSKEKKVSVSIISKTEAEEKLSPKAKEQKVEDERAEKERSTIAAHPLVQATEKIFSGKITNVKELGGKTP